MFAEGALNNAFMPLFAKKVEGEGEAAARDFAAQVFSVLLAWLVLFSAIAMIGMPVFIYVITWGFRGEKEVFDLTVALTRICFPYLLFMSLTALQSGVLNSLNRFTAAAAAPILLNVVMIASNGVAWLLGTGNTPATGYIFAWGVFASGIAQYALLTVACRRAGMPLVPRWPRLTPEVKRLITLAVPGIISGGVMQLNLLVATMIASTFSGAMAFLYYAERLYQLPLGVIGVAIGIVLLPDLSRKLRAGNEAGALTSQNRALEFSMFLTLPSAIALMAIPAPIIHTVFEHGAFSRADTLAVAPALLAFAIGLPAFALTKVFQPGFYAREDTRTPMHFALISVAVNFIGSVILSRYMGHTGIALATSLAAWVNTALLAVALSRRSLFSLDERSRQRLPRILISALLMGALLLGGQWLLRGNYAESAGFLAAAWGLLLLVSGGIVSYFALAHFTGAMRLNDFTSMLKR
jgi:putative peptidoglycan lipid II flippase